MKKGFYTLLAAVALMSCGNATDGDAGTHSTTITPDIGAMAPTDTANHINTNTGTYPGDTTSANKTDIRSSSSTDPGSRTTTPGIKQQ